MYLDKYVLQGLESCDFDDECDFCDEPKQGSYAYIIYHPEDVAETQWYMCGKCRDTAKEMLKNSDCATLLYIA